MHHETLPIQSIAHLLRKVAELERWQLGCRVLWIVATCAMVGIWRALP